MEVWQFFYEDSDGLHYTLPDCVFSDVEKATDWALKQGYEWHKKNVFELMAQASMGGIELRMFDRISKNGYEDWWQRLSLAPVQVDIPMCDLKVMNNDEE